MCRWTLAAIVYPLLLAAILLAQTATQKTHGNTDALAKHRPGLHAGITAQILPTYFAETPRVQLNLMLLNDSEKPLDVETGSWRIVVNGSELDDMDTQQIFGNGLTPQGTWPVLKPGEAYQSSKALSIEKFFPNGQNKVSWRGAAFQSPTITVTIPPASH